MRDDPRPGGILELPEFNVLLFAFLLNFPWEFLQVPFFRDMPAMDHWEAVRVCTQATVIAERWTYAEHMPVLPVLGTGLLPLMQWLILPPLIVWLVYRQIGR